MGPEGSLSRSQEPAKSEAPCNISYQAIILLWVVSPSLHLQAGGPPVNNRVLSNTPENTMKKLRIPVKFHELCN